MSYHVQINPQASISLDPLPRRSCVLMSFESAVNGLIQNCALLPVTKIDDLIAALKLAKTQAEPS